MNNSVGARIKSMREEMGLKQVELATKLSISAGSVSQFENDLIRPSYETLINLSTALEVTIEMAYNRKKVILAQKLFLKRGGLLPGSWLTIRLFKRLLLKTAS